MFTLPIDVGQDKADITSATAQWRGSRGRLLAMRLPFFVLAIGLPPAGLTWLGRPRHYACYCPSAPLS
jgi:hypothetical protein